MPRPRYAPDQLTALVREQLPTYETQGDPTFGKRMETWAAHSACGTWSYLRSETSGTPWHVRHRPTNYTTSVTWSRLDDARADTARPDALVWLWHDAAWYLDTYPEVVDGPAPITPHDEARALLTWIAERGPATATAARWSPIW